MNDHQTGHRVFSIGHSNQTLESFLDLLRKHQIEVVVDVRSQPYSKYASQFNADALKSALKSAGINYVFLGYELGGRPEGSEFYGSEGHVLYSRVAQSLLFKNGIERLEKGASEYRVAMMCSEENPADCHRHLLVARVLAARGVAVEHVRGDGRIETEAEVREAEKGCKDADQMRLFGDLEEPVWRSKRPIPKPPA